MLRSPWLLGWSLVLAPACSSPSGDTSSAGEASSSSDTTQTAESSEGSPGSSGAESDASSSDPATTSTSNDEDSSGAATGDETGTESSDGNCPMGTRDCPCRGESCDDEALQCVDGICVAPMACEAEIDLEPNDDESTAVDLGEMACGDPVAAAQGNVAEGEIDWWTYRGVASDECDESMVIVTADAELEVCAYFDCDMGGENVNCVGSRSAMSPDGREGCCGDGYVTSSTSCVGMSSDGLVFISVGGPGEPVCIDYELAYLFG